MTKKLYVYQGTTINPAWTDRVVFGPSSSGPWTVIRGSEIEAITQTRIINSGNVSNRSAHDPVERIRIKTDSGSDMSFDIKSVVNQAAWNVGGQAALSTAYNDIQGWV